MAIEYPEMHYLDPYNIDQIYLRVAGIIIPNLDTTTEEYIKINILMLMKINTKCLYCFKLRVNERCLLMKRFYYDVFGFRAYPFLGSKPATDYRYFLFSNI